MIKVVVMVAVVFFISTENIRFFTYLASSENLAVPRNNDRVIELYAFINLQVFKVFNSSVIYVDQPRHLWF